MERKITALTSLQSSPSCFEVFPAMNNWHNTTCRPTQNSNGSAHWQFSIGVKFQHPTLIIIVRLPGFSTRMHCVTYLDAISSFIALARCVVEVHTSECIGEDESCPANTFSVVNGQTLQVHNSCKKLW